MDQFQKISKDENGFVLVVSLLIMVILSLIGIAGLNTSLFEEQIAGNDWNAKRTFYRADGGISIGSELLEQNFNCTIGFQPTTGTDLADIEGTIRVMERNSNGLAIWTNSLMVEDSSTLLNKLNNPGNTYDAAFPLNNGVLSGGDIGYLFFGGQTNVLPGGALQMAAGYEGKGKSAGQGGVAKIFDIYSQYLGPKSSESIVLTGWRHLVGTEGSCIY